MNLICESCERMLDNVDLRNCTREEILFELEEGNKEKYQLLNHILIIVKFFIYKNRECKKSPSYYEIKNNILEDRLEERKLASVHERN